VRVPLLDGEAADFDGETARRCRLTLACRYPDLGPGCRCSLPRWLPQTLKLAGTQVGRARAPVRSSAPITELS
jgi:hypothetical protein